MCHHFFQKLKSSRKIQLLTVGGVAVIIASIAGLSAYRTSVTDPFTLDLDMRYGDNFEVSITNPEFKKYEEPERILPGQTVNFEPCLTNKGNYDQYVFMEVNLPDQDFSLNGMNSEWTEIESDDTRAIYAFGSSHSLTPLTRMSKDSNGDPVYTSTPSLCTGVTLRHDTDLAEQPFSVSAVGYAIQSDLNSSSPAKVWSMVEQELSHPEGDQE